MDWRIPFFLMYRPFLSKERRNPSITTGTTTGLYFLIMWAVPFRRGFHGVVVPCGKVITQPSLRAVPMLVISLIFTCRLTFLPSARQVRSMLIEPA